MSRRQILFGKKFKTLLSKIGELVMTYNVTDNIKTTIPRAFYALFMGPNDSGNGHQVFKLLLKQLVTTPKWKPVPIPDNVTQVVNDMEEQDVGGKPIHLSQIGSLHQSLQHLLLLVSTYHYSENAIANLLSYAKLADDYYIICNNRVNNAIYEQSKDDDKYL